MRAFVNGIALDFHLLGQGPTLVLIHALGLDRRMWNRQVPTLAESFQVLAYDVRGHGRSDKPLGPYTLETLSDDLHGLLDALGIESASLLGISLGGMIAQTFALAHPEKVDRLILADTTSEYPPEGRRQFVERARLVESSGTEPIAQATMERWFTQEFLAAETRVVDQIRQIFLGADPTGYSAACLAVSQVDLTSRLGAIQAETLVLVGDRDPGTPVEAATRIADAIPGARLEIIPDASHLSNIAQPDVFNQAVLLFLEGAIDRPDLSDRPLEIGDGPTGGDDSGADVANGRGLGRGTLGETPERGFGGSRLSALPEAGVGASGGGPPAEGYPDEERTDHEIAEGVRAAFFLVADFQENQFDVEAVDGVVRLRGKVRTEDDRTRAVEIAAGVVGVQRVLDELEVA